MAKIPSVPIDVSDRRDVSESAIIDPSTLRSGYHYRFVQVRPTNLARARLKGYRVVKPSETNEKTLYDQEDAIPEDVIKHGDRVLMAVPTAKHQSHREEIRRLTNSRLQSNDQRVRELAKRSKVKLHDKDEEDDE